MDDIYQTSIPELHIGKAVKRHRENAGYTLEEFSKMMGWSSRATASKVENDKRVLSSEELYRAATILNQPLSAFFPAMVQVQNSDDTPSIEAFSSEIIELANELAKEKGKVTPDIEEKARTLFQRELPATIYRVLNTTPNEVSIRATLKRGPHFIPRIEIRFLGRLGYELNWFGIVITFKEGLRHIYLSLVQDSTIETRADIEPTDLTEQLDVMRKCLLKHIDSVSKSPLMDWDLIEEKYFPFLDENGNIPENGTLISKGYVPIDLPAAYDITINSDIRNYNLFVMKNPDGRKDILDENVPKYVVNTFHRDQENHVDEYALLNDMERDIIEMFDQLRELVHYAEQGSFIRWKKEIIQNMAYEDLDDANMVASLSGTEVVRTERDAFGWYFLESPRRKAVEKAEYKCEVNPKHETFIDKQTEKRYMEISYLIPLSEQYKFNKNLDCMENMICVCPLCSRKLRRGKGRDLEDMIVPLYYSKRDKLVEAGIEISLGQLLDFYDEKERR